jgi:hypothetical protein
VENGLPAPQASLAVPFVGVTEDVAADLHAFAPALGLHLQAVIGLLAGAYAQTPIEPVSPAPQIAVAPATVVIPELVGRKVRNLENELIGEIRSISVGEDGTLQGVTVSLDAIPALRGRFAHIWWKALHISDNGENVVVDIAAADLHDMVRLTSPDIRPME